MMIALASILGAGAVFLVLAYLVRARGPQAPETRLRHLAPREAVAVQTGADGNAVLRRRGRLRIFAPLIDRNRYAARWALELERADAKMRPGEYFLLRLALAAAIAVVVSLVGRNAAAVVVGLAAGGVAYMVPAFWLRIRARRRLRQIEAQLVETISLISNALRAGFAFAQAVDLTAKRVGPPISVELGRALLDINLGASAEDALTAMNERIGSDDLDIVVTAILIQRNAGGNLAEVLDNVCETMRDRERIRGEIRTMTTQQQFTGWVLSFWPATLGLIFFAINPSMTALLWTTSAGLVLLGIWAGLNTVGIVAIRRILDIDI
jgi:tight adherence protein B